MYVYIYIVYICMYIYCKCVYIYIYIISLYNLALGYLGMMVRILTNQQVELSNRIMTEFIERQHGF